MAHVLIISADPHTVEDVVASCHDACHTSTLVSENQAIDRCLSERPDLVLLACANPRPFARALRSLLPHTPVVAICEDPSLHDQVELRKAGVTSFVFRPYAIQTLRKVYADFLSGGAALEPLERASRQ
ncbi:MAG: hypothetical protein JWM80_819 [Cyanobacteria bacterium RYN_339]|nr:hypothetical protein [Cyanobacteria bacterium RYN_339]